MISVSFFLHPSRIKNFNQIYKAYKDYKIIDEVLIVTGQDVKIEAGSPKFKFVHFPGPYHYGSWPHLGLLARYTFALSCKNKYVLMQDDDFLYKEETIKKMLSLNTPITGCHYRWCDGKHYSKKPLDGSKPKTAPLILTGGTLVDTTYLPGVISYAKQFWSKDEYQQVFNGEDLFMSRAISKLSGIDEFPCVKDKFISLPTYENQLYLQHNSIEDRIKLRNRIYDFFEDLDDN